MRTAMKAPVVMVVMEASLPLDVAEAADEAALPVPEAAELLALLVAEATLDEAPEVARSASAVAFRVPHCWFVRQAAWA